MWNSSQAENSWGQRLGKEATLSSSRELPRPGNRALGSWEEKGAITLCLWQRLRASSKHVVELAELALGMCSAIHVSSVVLKW